MVILGQNALLVSAQSLPDPKVEFCLDANGGVLKSGDKNCDATSPIYSTSRYLVNGSFYGICRSVNKIAIGYTLRNVELNNNQPTCPDVNTNSFTLLPTNIFTSLQVAQKPVPTPKPTTNQNTPTNNTTVSTQCGEGLTPSGPLCLPNNPFNKNSSIAATSSLKDLIPKIINFLLWGAGIVAVFMIIYGGYQTMTAGGNTQQATDGRKTLTNAIIGLIIVVFSYTVVNVVVNFITSGTK